MAFCLIELQKMPEIRASKSSCRLEYPLKCNIEHSVICGDILPLFLSIERDGASCLAHSKLFKVKYGIQLDWAKNWILTLLYTFLKSGYLNSTFGSCKSIKRMADNVDTDLLSINKIH